MTELNISDKNKSYHYTKNFLNLNSIVYSKNIIINRRHDAIFDDKTQVLFGNKSTTYSNFKKIFNYVCDITNKLYNEVIEYEIPENTYAIAFSEYLPYIYDDDEYENNLIDIVHKNYHSMYDIKDRRGVLLFDDKLKFSKAKLYDGKNILSYIVYTDTLKEAKEFFGGF
ncbi:MAG: hypothetical protein [Caudoviricetes sp.]|nr:MAG: hypothetical protein [Caudoviricetes sp.]